MYVPPILNGSWEGYDDRKKSTGQNPQYISPENLWEFNYLVDMILTDRPKLDHISVILSVRDVMRKTMGPRPRHHFVEMVMNDINDREKRWELLLKSINRETPHTTPYDENRFSIN